MIDALNTLAGDVVDALRLGLDGIVPASKILGIKPHQPAAPTVYLEPFGMTPDTVGGGVVEVVAVTGEVVALVDGDTGPAVVTTRLLQAAIWQALYPLVTMTGSTPGPIDVGGPTLYGVRSTFVATVSITSICPLVLVTPSTQEVPA